MDNRRWWEWVLIIVGTLAVLIATLELRHLF